MSLWPVPIDDEEKPSGHARAGSDQTCRRNRVWRVRGSCNPVTPWRGNNAEDRVRHRCRQKPLFPSHRVLCVRRQYQVRLLVNSLFSPARHRCVPRGSVQHSAPARPCRKAAVCVRHCRLRRVFPHTRRWCCGARLVQLRGAPGAMNGVHGITVGHHTVTKGAGFDHPTCSLVSLSRCSGLPVPASGC